MAAILLRGALLLAAVLAPTLEGGSMAPSAPGFSAMGALSAQGKGGAPGLNAWQERAATLTALRGGGGAEGAAAIASAGPGNARALGALARHCWVPGSKSHDCADQEDPGGFA